MPDEVEVCGWLQSQVYGGLLQVLDTMSRTVEADIAAGRVFGMDAAVVAHCVRDDHLNITPRERAGLRNWPCQQGGIFEALYHQRPASGVTRAHEHFESSKYASTAMFQQVAEACQVVDCVCESVDLCNRTWGVLLYVRCAPASPFQDERLDTLRRFHPTIQRSLAAAVDRECRPADVESAVTTVPISKLLARLSCTERQVLDYLRTSLTERKIASELERSHHTVHVHVKNIYRKFGVSSRKELMELFIDD